MNQEPSFRKSAGWKVLVFVAGTVLLGALLAPPLYWAGKMVAREGWIENVPLLDSIHDSMERARFSRYFNRAVLAGALIMLFPTLRWLRRTGERKVSWRERLQLRPNRRWIPHLIGGFFLAAIPLFLLAWFYLRNQWYTPRESDKALAGILLGALGSGLAVALLEEFVFRGALTSVFSSLLKPWPLLLAVAVFFAVVHFLKPPHAAEFAEVTAWSGFAMLGLIFSQFGNWYFLAAEFAVLFAIGWVLGYTRLKTASLWLGIGLHAGWVFGVKTLGPLTARNFEPSAMMPWLGGNLRVGLASSMVVCLTGLGVWIWLKTEGRGCATRDQVQSNRKPAAKENT